MTLTCPQKIPLPERIVISKFHMKLGYWGASIPSKVVVRSGIHRGKKYIMLDRCYFPDTNNGNKLRYQMMTAEKASYDWIHDMYFEVLPGVYVYIMPATSSNAEINVERGLAAIGKVPFCNLTKFESELMMIN